MTRKNTKFGRYYAPFEDTVRKICLNGRHKSLYQVTKELNDLLEDMFYGINKPKKRKRN